MSDLHAELQDVFRDVFEEDDLVIDDTMTADDIDGWDSLTHINLIIAIERAFGIKFATAEIARLKEEGSNVGSIATLIARKREAKG